MHCKSSVRFLAFFVSIILSLSLFTSYWILNSPGIANPAENLLLISENFAENSEIPQRYGHAVTVNKFSQIEKEIDERIQNVESMCRSYHLGRYKWSHNGSNDLRLKEPPTPLYSYYFWNR